MKDDTIPIERPQFRGAMAPVPPGHPARPRSAGARFPYPTQRRIDWCELGWRVVPYVCALAVAALIYVLGQPQ